MGKRRAIASLLCAALAFAPAVLPRTATAAGPESTIENSTRVKGLNDRAQAAYAANDFQGAALSWSEILKVLPENRTNREERETALLVAIDAYIRAYEEGGSRADEAAIGGLQVGVDTFDRYEKEYVVVYGSGAQVSLEAGERGAKIKALLESAKPQLPQQRDPEVKQPIADPRFVVRPVGDLGPSGLGLIVGGSAAIVGGLGATSMIIIGAIMGKRAQEESSDPNLTDKQEADIDRRIRTGNGLVIGGSILTGVLLIGGATMLGFGIKRRVRYLAVTPSVQRHYVGVSLGGRF